MFNKIIVAGIISTVALVGCSSQASPQPVVTVTESVEVPQQESYDDGGVTNEDIYLLSLRSVGNPILNSGTDAELLELGYAVCEILSQGYSTEDIIYYMAKEMANDGNVSDVYAQAVGSIIGAAEVGLCTSY